MAFINKHDKTNIIQISLIKQGFRKNTDTWKECTGVFQWFKFTLVYMLIFHFCLFSSFSSKNVFIKLNVYTEGIKIESKLHYFNNKIDEIN